MNDILAVEAVGVTERHGELLQPDSSNHPTGVIVPPSPPSTTPTAPTPAALTLSQAVESIQHDQRHRGLTAG